MLGDLARQLAVDIAGPALPAYALDVAQADFICQLANASTAMSGGRVTVAASVARATFGMSSGHRGVWCGRSTNVEAGRVVTDCEGHAGRPRREFACLGLQARVRLRSHVVWHPAPNAGKFDSHDPRMLIWSSAATPPGCQLAEGRTEAECAMKRKGRRASRYRVCTTYTATVQYLNDIAYRPSGGLGPRACAKY